MNLSIGIVGLPNVGKSTTFNALTQAQNAEVANYPFCTIQPNRALVPVPDARLDRLGEIVEVPEIIHATIEFVDVAGLVKGASKGEGLGNQFLGNIRDVDAILHVVRCFDDPGVVHVSAEPDPRDDIEVINTELALADLEQLERKIERLEGQAKADAGIRPLLAMAHQLAEHLNTGKPLWAYPEQNDEHFRALVHEMRFLTAKPVIYAANVGEGDLAEDNDCVQTVREIAAAQGAQVVKLCAELEQELAGLPADEQQGYLELAGIERSGLEQIIRQGYDLLGVISYFSFNQQEARAWTIHKGWTAPQAAGVIHTDFERGFIRAEVVPFEVFAEHGSWGAVRTVGLQRVEGRDYVVQDGDVINFRFNV